MVDLWLVLLMKQTPNENLFDLVSISEISRIPSCLGQSQSEFTFSALALNIRRLPHWIRLLGTPNNSLLLDGGVSPASAKDTRMDYH